jgi:hypothetical protein
MISETIQKDIGRAHKFRQELEAMVYRRGECTLDERGVQLIAYFALVLDYHVQYSGCFPWNCSARHSRWCVL